jgi:catechol 2,3-dioxygenase-like lactoylglutathione lyase family enzyme
MTEYRCDHVHLRSLDPEAAAQFYIDMFGAKLVGKAETAASFRVTINLGGLAVFIDRVPAGTHGPLAPPALGVEHIGLVVADLETAARELEAKGAVFTTRPTSPRPGTKICFIRAPDGAQIEVLERTPV